MKFLNKIIPCLIVASFIFSGEGFALKRNTNEDRRSLPTKHRSIQQRLKPLPKRERANVAKPRKASIQKSRTPRRPEAATQRKPIRAKKHKQSRPEAARKRPVVRTKTPRKSRSAPTNPVDKPVAAPKVKKAKAIKTAPVDKPVAAPKAKKAKAVRPVTPPQEKPKKPAKKTTSTAPKKYTITTSDLPEDIKRDLRLLGIEEDEFSNKKESLTPNAIRKILGGLEKAERKVLQDILNSGEFSSEEEIQASLNTADDLPEEEKRMASLIGNGKLSIRIRNFLRENYGFEG